MLVTFGIGVWLWARGRSTWARIEVSDGKVDVARGSLSASMRRDIQEAVRLARYRDGRIRLVFVKEGLGVKLRPDDDGLEQRLRNIVRTWSI